MRFNSTYITSLRCAVTSLLFFKRDKVSIYLKSCYQWARMGTKQMSFFRACFLDRTIFWPQQIFNNFKWYDVTFATYQFSIDLAHMFHARKRNTSRYFRIMKKKKVSTTQPFFIELHIIFIQYFVILSIFRTVFLIRFVVVLLVSCLHNRCWNIGRRNFYFAYIKFSPQMVLEL